MVARTPWPARARHPDRVAAVGAVACPGVVPELDPPRLHEDPEDERDARVRELLEAGDVEEAVVELSAAIRGYRDHVLDEDDATVVDRWADGMDPDDVEVVRSLPAAELAAGVRESLASPVGYIRDVLAFLGDWEVRPEGVRSPTWLWYGAEDRNAAPRHGEWLAQRIPGRPWWSGSRPRTWGRCCCTGRRCSPRCGTQIVE